MTVLVKNMARGKRSASKVRVYVLLDIVKGRSGSVVSILRSKPGVVMADIVEPQSDVIMVVEAEGRERLAELTTKALASIEQATVDVHLMPAEPTRNKNYPES